MLEELVIHAPRELFCAFEVARVDRFGQPIDRQLFHLGDIFGAQQSIGLVHRDAPLV